MRKPVTVLIAFVLGLAGAVLVVSLLRDHPGVSMNLVEYKRWPHGAMLRLTNGTQTTISYVAEPDDTPAGSLVLCLQKTSSGWTNTSSIYKRESSIDGSTGNSIEVFVRSDPSAPRKPGHGIPALLARVLKPGQSVEFFVRLEPDALPKRVGTICCVPPTRFAATVQPWLARVKKWCRIKPKPSGQLEVWCATPLSISLSPQPTTRN